MSLLMKAGRCLLLLALVLAGRAAHGDPVQSEVAITLPKGTTTVRSFVRVTEFSRGGDVVEVQNQIAHGFTAKTNLTFPGFDGHPVKQSWTVRSWAF